MAKKILGYIKLQVPAGSATPSPPIGPALGQRGVNIMGFCKEFNARTEKEQKGTPLHDATVIGDTVGDPFKDTSSVALNPVIKFTTLFGLLAVELAVKLASDQGTMLTRVLALAFFVVSFTFVYRSFYGMRIQVAAAGVPGPASPAAGG